MERINKIEDLQSELTELHNKKRKIARSYLSEMTKEERAEIRTVFVSQEVMDFINMNYDCVGFWPSIYGNNIPDNFYDMGNTYVRIVNNKEENYSEDEINAKNSLIDKKI